MRKFILRRGYPLALLALRVYAYIARAYWHKSILVRTLGRISFGFLRPLSRPLALPVANRLAKLKNKKLIENDAGRKEFDAFLHAAATGSNYCNVDHLKFIFGSHSIDVEFLHQAGHQFMVFGRMDLANATFLHLVQLRLAELPQRLLLQIFRDLGVTFFLMGKIAKANSYWAEAGKLRQMMVGPNDGPSYRILGSTWFVAIGHVAMLDYYLKFRILHGHPEDRIVAPVNFSSIPGAYLCEKFAALGIQFIGSGLVESDYNKWAKRNGKRLWQQLTVAEQIALNDEFWEYEFNDGEILGYTHAAARIQREWEANRSAPILSFSEEERAFQTNALRILGLPKDAWYVCFHIREAGFHKNWNNLYPSMRDAEVDDYSDAMRAVVSRGGWVLRMGDQSMQRLPPMENVIDYAHSSFKTPIADSVLPLGARFFLGTNSGYATIPAIYGIPCAFTNWVPLGLPLWPTQDRMIPKLFRVKSEDRLLSLGEIFDRGLAFIQNWSDLPNDIELIKNSSAEIRGLVEEMLDLTEPAASDAQAEDSSVMEHYRSIAKKHGTYVGSCLSTDFVRRHPSVFSAN